jgi:hypothetical protein
VGGGRQLVPRLEVLGDEVAGPAEQGADRSEQERADLKHARRGVIHVFVNVRARISIARSIGLLDRPALNGANVPLGRVHKILGHTLPGGSA